MKLTSMVKKVISHKLGLQISEISEMSAERLDEHIAKNVTKKDLRIGKPGSRLVKRRGLMFSTVSKSDLNSRIDNMLCSSFASK